MPTRYFIDAVHGDDQADGLSENSAFRTLEHALAHSAPGDILLLRAGQHFRTDKVLGEGRTITVWGEGDAPLIDARQLLGDAAWEHVSGNVYRAEVTFRDAPFANHGPNAANSTHHQIWSGLEKLSWQFSGNTIEDNITAFLDQPGSFTLHQLGSDIPDPRNDAVGNASFVVYLHLPDGSDPTGQDISIADQSAILTGNFGLVEGVTLIGNFGKDGNGLRTDENDILTQFHDVTILDAPSHGLVGPLNSTGTLTVSGRENAGHRYHEFDLNSEGALVNIYTDQLFENTLLHFESIIASHGYKAIFGHGTASRIDGYHSLHIEELMVTNVGIIYEMDSPLGERPFMPLTTIDHITADSFTIGFKSTGDMTINQADLVFAEPVFATSSHQLLFLVRGDNQLIRLSDATLSFSEEFNRISGSHALIGGDQGFIISTVLILDNVHDQSAPDSAGSFVRHQEWGPSLVITGGSTLGDLQSVMDDARALPTALIIEAGSTFGLGGRTGPEIQALLTEAGIPHLISTDTTIIDREGNILSAPGWEASEGLPSSLMIIGDESGEVLPGTAGDDTIEGGLGSDYIAGGQGNDLLIGDTSSEEYDGGAA